MKIQIKLRESGKTTKQQKESSRSWDFERGNFAIQSFGRDGFIKICFILQGQTANNTELNNCF